MVHALGRIHHLLKPDGLLIDIHPAGTPPPVEVHSDGCVTRAGYLDERDAFVEYPQAEAALKAVVRQGLFAVERTGLFLFSYRADSYDDLRLFIEREWTDSFLPPEVEERVRALMDEPGRNKAIMMHELIRIARLRRLLAVGG